jgi:hypothetical protein
VNRAPIRAIRSFRESYVRRAFKNSICDKFFTLPSNAKISRSARPICFLKTKYSSETTIPFWVMRHVSQERVEARRVRPDQRCVEGVGNGGGQPGSSAKEGRSLAVDQCSSSPSDPIGGGGRHQRRGGQQQREERYGLTATVLEIGRLRKNMYGGFRLYYSYPTPSRLTPRSGFPSNPSPRWFSASRGATQALC